MESADRAAMMHGMAVVTVDSGFFDDAISFYSEAVGIASCFFEEGAVFSYHSNL